LSIIFDPQEGRIRVCKVDSSRIWPLGTI
jgi:hypothetical protein